MVRHRSHSVEFKCRVAQDYLAGETLYSLARQHDLALARSPRPAASCWACWPAAVKADGPIEPCWR